MPVPAILFDFDNTMASTNSIREIRESGAYNLLTAEAMAKVKLYKPVPGMLDSLRKSGVKIGIVTNAGRGYVDAVFKHLGIADVFDVVVTYTDVKRDGMKPSPKGILLALEKLGVKPDPEILYVGDDNHDHVAAYKAGIRPVMPSWASRAPVTMAPALEMSSEQLLDYIGDPGEYKLFAERCAELLTDTYERKGVYFLPMDSSANVVTLREEMTGICLGRYFSQKAAVTAWMHDHHSLSKEIQRKEEETPYQIPEHWAGMLAHVIRHAPSFVYRDEQAQFDIATVIPSKKGKDQRLERLLDMVKTVMAKDANTPSFTPGVFYFVDDAQSQKNLSRHERSSEARRALQLNGDAAPELEGKHVLIIDDVTTTGSTLARARELALAAGAASVVGLAVAKTVSIMEDERPCPVCGRAMRLRKNSRTHDRFWGCTGYVDEENPCKHTEPLMKKHCPRCEREMRMHTNRYTGVKFWSCTGYNQTPSCNYSMDVDPNELPP